MKLPRKVVTKKDKKRAIRNKSLLIIISIGLMLLLIPLVYLSFFNKEPLFISPLSKNQNSNISQLESMLSEKNIKYSDVSTSKDLSFLIILEDGNEVIVDPNKDIEQQLSSLQLIISQLTIEGKTFKKLDFRFEKPFIKLNND